MMSHGRHETDMSYGSEDAWAGVEPYGGLCRPGVFARAHTRREGVTFYYGYLWGWRRR